MYWKLWFNGFMFKTEAIELLGGSATSAADLMGVTYQAVNKWPAVLPSRISDRVLGVCARRGISIPVRFVEPRDHAGHTSPALAGQAPVAINSEVKEVSHA